MKIVLAILIVLAAIVACGCTAAGTPAQNTTGQAPAAAIPNLTGTWTSTITGYEEGMGFTDYPSDSLVMVVTEQKGRVFAGQIQMNFNTTKSSIPFTGVIGRDGTSISLTEKDNGYAFGEMISENEMEITYLIDTTPYSVSIDTFKRA